MPNEMKTLLKEAREFFKQREYQEAMKKCKKILKNDKNNYAALILLAAAMHEVEESKSQVELVLQRAIEIQPSNSLAWQGLVAHYEKGFHDSDNWEKLAMAYCKLLLLDSESPKFTHFLSKVSELALKIKDDYVFSEVLGTLSTLRKLGSEERTSLIDKNLAWLLTECSSNVDKHRELLEDVLASIVTDTDLVNRQEYYRKYLKLLFDANKFTVLLTEAQVMHAQFPQDIHPLELICRVYYEEAVLNENVLKFDITQFYESLLKLNASSEIAYITKAVYLKSTDDLINCRECLNRATLLNVRSFCAWFMLSQVYYELYCWEDAENASRQALQFACPRLRDKLRHKIELILVEAISRSSNDEQKLTLARQMCEELLRTKSSMQLQLIHARTSILLEESDGMAALSSLESQEKTKTHALIIRALYLTKHKQLEEAINVLELALENSEAWLLFGKIYWDLGDYNHSLVAFLNGVQSDRNNWECMVYLGHYYREHGNDIERSRRCYQAAVQINPNSEEAGIGLSTAYRLLKNTDANIQLLQTVTTRGTGPKWAWLQLGLQYLDQNDAMQAIKALQHVIRTDPNDNHSWESLADAYLVRGAHTSALKSYQRALELSPGSLYPMIQLANIKLLIGQHKEAKKDFKIILQNNEQYIPALKGLAQAYLGLARENFAKQFLSRAKKNLQRATDRLTDAVMIRSDLSCNWKLLGDACYRVATMSKKYCYLKIKPILMKSDSYEEHIVIEGDEILTLSIRCFCRALSLAQNSALLWHDLTCCYLLQLQRTFASSRNDVAIKCLAAAKQAVKLCPQSWLHWNVLGVICMSPYIKSYALAQHCFIMSIDRESNSAIAWSNLGTLYLHLGDLYKANEAFSRAQRADPSYMNSWIGQGIIAESSLRKEAMDLFQHSMQLGYHNQAALGYAHWVLTVLLDPAMKKDPLCVYFIQNMHAISAVTDILHWYTEHEPDDVYALNTYGLLLERQKLYNSAAKQLARALELSKDEQRDMVSINMARVLIQIGKYDEAVKLCRQEKLVSSFNLQCHLALSLFKAKQYEESYNAYETALHWLANTDADKANILCAMAAIAYIFQGADAVKTLLFQCVQIEPPTIVGFLAIAALGILHNDYNLTSLVLKELKPFENHPEYGHHAVTLTAYYHVVQGDFTEAIRVLTKAIHRHPSDIRYWVRLIRILLLDTNLDIFRRCARKALILSRNTSATDIVYVACASAYSYFGTTEGLRQAQKNVFTYPANVESWANFVAALLSRCTDKDFKVDSKWISSLVSMIRSQFQTTKNMSRWLLQPAQEISDV